MKEDGILLCNILYCRIHHFALRPNQLHIRTDRHILGHSEEVIKLDI